MVELILFLILAAVFPTAAAVLAALVGAFIVLSWVVAGFMSFDLPLTRATWIAIVAACSVAVVPFIN